MKPIRVAIIEDRPEYSTALKLLLEGDPRFAYAASFAKGEDAIKRLPYERPDVVLTDINLLGALSGIEAMSAIKQVHPKILFLMLTVLEDEDKIFRALEAGASGYLLKDAGYARILEAIVELYNGGSPMSAGVARKVVESFKKPLSDKTIPYDKDLTEREKEILEELCKGKKLKAIAADLFISIETVKTHCHNIYEKLHVKSRIEMMAKIDSKSDR
jgi:DNA-binding NarL/FixJ family response regulator